MSVTGDGVMFMVDVCEEMGVFLVLVSSIEMASVLSALF